MPIAKLRKTTPKEFHPRCCKTLQLGSFDYYRTIENDDLRDEFEAKRHTVFENCKLSSRDWNFLSGGGLASKGYSTPELYGELTLAMPGEVVILNRDGWVEIKGRIVCDYTSFDSFICCTSIDDGSFAWPHDPVGTDHWTIKYKDANKFSEALRQIVKKHLQNDETLLEQISELNELPAGQLTKETIRVAARYDWVEYKTRRISYTGDLRGLNLSDGLEHLLSPFVKDPIEKFKSEREYRFCFNVLFKTEERQFRPIRKLPQKVFPRVGALKRFMSYPRISNG
ncbi:hypothetical protein [uncultured Pelagimonas sp.]|uniref:hypothetical protein n=1 Tax=uncultured Pelagimonas sp. TaxID=1618102 RepID=UPI002639E395|nr:hypothetical protein [uncultured Pelagimonas sp.]